MLRTCVVLTVALVAAGAGANSTRGAELWSLLQVWRPALQLQWSDSPALSAQCGASMQRFSRALDERQQWASRMLDASGGVPSQFLEGNDYWLGSRSECEDSRDDNHVAPVFRVASLSVNLSEPLVTPQLKDFVAGQLLPRRIYLGLCIPAECGAKDEVRTLLELMIDNPDPIVIREYRDVQVHGIKVIPGDYSMWNDTFFYALLLMVGTVVLLTLVCTTIDVLNLGVVDPKIEEQLTNGSRRDLLLSFSLPRNARSFFSTSSKEGNLGALHGMRVFGMAWILMCHLSRWALVFGENPSFRTAAENDFLFQFVVNGTYSVDTFFFISGVLVAYQMLRAESGKTEAKEQDSICQTTQKLAHLTFYRFLRLTPPYLFLILLEVVSMRQLNSTSIFENSLMDHVYCGQYWWRNLLYINNLFPVSEMCMSFTWYLAADMQLYIVSIALLLIFTNRYTRVAVISGCVLLLSSWLTSGAISFSLDFIPTIEDPAKHYDLLHDKPWLRFGPYFVGMATGWVLHNTNGKIAFSKSMVVAGWTVCAVGMVGVVHALYFRAFGVLTSALYVSLSHTLWAVCLAWILVACTTGYGGWASHVLSSPLLAPLGKATYCAYLIHCPMMEWVFLNMAGSVPLSHGFLVTTWLGFTLWSFLAGTLMSLLLESPSLRLLSAMRPAQRRPAYQQPQPAAEMCETGELDAKKG